MKIIVDTCIWALALRRSGDTENNQTGILKKLIFEQKVQMIGPIRQELLSGIRSAKQLNQLKSYLLAFPDIPIRTLDYELAAEFYNINRKKGIQGSNTDFLICALSHNYEFPIFTEDQDFFEFAKNIPIVLYKD